MDSRLLCLGRGAILFLAAEPLAAFTTPSLHGGLAGSVGCGERGRSFRMASREGANRINEPATKDAVRAGRFRARRSPHPTGPGRGWRRDQSGIHKELN